MRVIESRLGFSRQNLSRIYPTTEVKSNREQVEILMAKSIWDSTIMEIYPVRHGEQVEILTTNLFRIFFTTEVKSNAEQVDILMAKFIQDMPIIFQKYY